MAPFVWQNGGEIAEGDKFTFDQPEAVEATEFYQSFFDEKLTPPGTPQGFDITPAFVRGTHPMFFSGPWHMGLIEEAGGKGFERKWAIAKMPTEKTATSFVGGGDLVVFKDSENRDAAWKFVEYLPSPRCRRSATRSRPTCRPSSPPGTARSSPTTRSWSSSASSSRTRRRRP